MADSVGSQRAAPVGGGGGSSSAAVEDWVLTGEVEYYWSPRKRTLARSGAASPVRIRDGSSAFHLIWQKFPINLLLFFV